MSGFARTLQRTSPRRQRIREAVAEMLCLEDVSARVMRERDPFDVDDRCEFNATGHQTIVSCGEAVCFHCARIFWK
jgi:hypothetical protein